MLKNLTYVLQFMETFKVHNPRVYNALRQNIEVCCLTVIAGNKKKKETKGYLTKEKSIMMVIRINGNLCYLTTIHNDSPLY